MERWGKRMNDLNPYASPPPIEESPGQLMHRDTRVARGLLHRTITFAEPFQAQLDYDGKYFRQRVYVGQICVWHRISWLRIHPRIDFVWPAEVAGTAKPGRIEMKFNHLLQIVRFTVYCDGVVIYNEHKGMLTTA